MAWRKQVALRWHELHGGEARQEQLRQLPVLLGVLCDAASIAHAQAMFEVQEVQGQPPQSQQAQAVAPGVLPQAPSGPPPQQQRQACAAAELQQGSSSPRMGGGQGSGPGSTWAAALRVPLPAPEPGAVSPAGVGLGNGFMAACRTGEAAGPGSPAAAVPTPTLKVGNLPRLAITAQQVPACPSWGQGEAALRVQVPEEEEGGQQGAWQQGQGIARLPGGGEARQEEGAIGQGACDHCQPAPCMASPSPPLHRSYSSPLSLVSEELAPQQQQAQTPLAQQAQQQQWEGWFSLEEAQAAPQAHQAPALLAGGGWGGSGQEQGASWHQPVSNRRDDDLQRQHGNIALSDPGPHPGASPHAQRQAADEQGGQQESAFGACNDSHSPGASPHTAAPAGSLAGICQEDALPVGGSGGSGSSGTGILPGSGIPLAGSREPLLRPVLLRHFRPSFGKAAEEWGLTGREVSITGLPAGVSVQALRTKLEGAGATGGAKNRGRALKGGRAYCLPFWCSAKSASAHCTMPEDVDALGVGVGGVGAVRIDVKGLPGLLSSARRAAVYAVHAAVAPHSAPPLCIPTWAATG